MKNLSALILFLLSTNCFAQKVFRVDNISNEYYGKISLEQPGEVFSPGWVAIFDKKSNKELLKVVSEELALSLHNGKALANVKEVPYGEQSIIIYEDFNFDGKKDFALEDGQHSYYHGPSFQIYLATNNSFVNNGALTELAQSNCGMFEVDVKNKTIGTSTKSGCCWHQYSTYKYINNKLKVIKIVEEDAGHMPLVRESIQLWNGIKMVTTEKRKLDIEKGTRTDVVSFKLEKNGKEVQVFAYDKQLHYVLIDKKGELEFVLPYESIDPNGGLFKFMDNENGRSVYFPNDNATYEIREIFKGPDAGKISLIVTLNGKTYPSAAAAGSKKGSLKNLPMGLDNGG